MNRRDLLKSSALTALATAGYVASTRWSTAAASGDGSIITLAYPAGFADLDPATSFSDDAAILANVYETLTRYIPARDGQPARVDPLLATKWAVAADGLSWTFDLRSDVKFHDGTPLTSAAVKGSIERTIKIAGGASFIWAGVEAIEAPDPLTVVMKLSYPKPMNMVAAAGFAAWIMSPSAFDKDNAWFNAGNDAGTGPFRIQRYEPGQRVVLSRAPDYRTPAVKGAFETAIFEVVEDVALSQRMIEVGDADWAYGMPYENLEALKANPDLNVVVNSSFETLIGLYNTRKAPLDRPKVRHALSLAFPYDDVIAGGTAGLAARAYGVIPSGIWGHDEAAPIPQTDLGAARALLAEEGMAEGGFELVMTYVPSEPLEALAGELWKANLKKLGITLTLQPMAWEAQWQFAKSNPSAAQDIFVLLWWPTYVTPYDYLFNMFHSEKQPNYNLGYYANPAFDKLIDDANIQAGIDIAKAEQQFKQAQRMLIEDQAAVFMLDRPNIHIIRSDIKGYVDNPAYAHVVSVNELSR